MWKGCVRWGVADLAACLSSAKHDWGTPQAFFDRLHAEFHFTVDAAANATNHKLPRWYGPGGEREDALDGFWATAETYWCNPPYGRQQAGFVKLAYDVMVRGGLAVLLLPARTDTRVFHTFIWDADNGQPYRGVDVRFLRGRLMFEGASAPAPFPSMAVVFDGR